MYFTREGKNDISHATMISKVTKDDILFTGHSANRFDKSLAEVISDYKKVQIIRLKDSTFTSSFARGKGGGGVR